LRDIRERNTVGGEGEGATRTSDESAKGA
jgi:hypothetical protein